MNDDCADTACETGEAAGDIGTEAEAANSQTAGRVQRAMAQAQDAAGQVGGMVRARPLAMAAVALGVGYLVGRRR